MTDTFAFPFRIDTNGLPRVVEQDTLEEIEQNVMVLVLTELGERQEVPGFGVPDPTFTQGRIDVELIHDAAVEWDERAELAFDEGLDGRIRNLLIKVTGEK